MIIKILAVVMVLSAILYIGFAIKLKATTSLLLDIILGIVIVPIIAAVICAIILMRKNTAYSILVFNQIANEKIVSAKAIEGKIFKGKFFDSNPNNNSRISVNNILSCVYSIDENNPFWFSEGGIQVKTNKYSRRLISGLVIIFDYESNKKLGYIKNNKNETYKMFKITGSYNSTKVYGETEEDCKLAELFYIKFAEQFKDIGQYFVINNNTVILGLESPILFKYESGKRKETLYNEFGKLLGMVNNAKKILDETLDEVLNNQQ